MQNRLRAMLKRTGLLAITLVATLALFTACGSDDQPDSSELQTSLLAQETTVDTFFCHSLQRDATAEECDAADTQFFDEQHGDDSIWDPNAGHGLPSDYVPPAGVSPQKGCEDANGIWNGEDEYVGWCDYGDGPYPNTHPDGTVQEPYEEPYEDPYFDDPFFDDKPDDRYPPYPEDDYDDYEEFYPDEDDRYRHTEFDDFDDKPDRHDRRDEDYDYVEDDEFFTEDDRFTEFDQEHAFNDGNIQRLKEQGARVLYEIKKSGGEDFSREFGRNFESAEDQLRRIKNRAAGVASCPFIEKAEDTIAAVADIAETMANVDESTLEDALAAEEELYGHVGQDFGSGPTGPGFDIFDATEDYEFRGPKGLFDEMWQAVGNAHMCEAVAFAIQDLSREVKEMEREIEYVEDPEIKADLEALLAEMKSVADNPYQYADFDVMQKPCFGYDCPGPMEEMWEVVDEIRHEFWITMEDEINHREEEGICGTLDHIKDFMRSDNFANVPGNLSQEGLKIVNFGLRACEEGDREKASKALRKLEEMKPDFERYIDIPEDEDFEGDLEEGFGFSGLDPKEFMREELQRALENGEDLDAVLEKIEDELFSRMDRAVEAAVDAATQRYVAKIAQLESRFAEDLNADYSRAIDNNILSFRGDVRENLMENKSDLMDVIADLDAVMTEVDDKSKLKNSIINDFKAINKFITEKNLSTEATTAVKQQIVSATNAASAAGSDAEDILETELDTALENIEAIYEEDVDAQIAEGFLPTADLFEKEDQWYFPTVTAAYDRSYLTGKTLATGERAMIVDDNANVAEALTITARVKAGGSDNVPSTVIDHPFVNNQPDWAKPAASYLINNGVDLDKIMAGKRPEEPVDRKQLFELTANALDLETEANGADVMRNKFTDVASGNYDDDTLRAAHALYEAGVISGEGDGSLNLDGTVNRAAFGTVMVQAEEEITE